MGYSHAFSTKCTYDCQPSIDIKIEVKLPDGAKDPVFWFIAQSKKASLEKKPLPSRKVGEATQKEEAIGKVSNLVSEVSLVSLV